MSLVAKKQKIAIVYKYIPQYRKEFFIKLKEKLSHENIELRLIYGQPGKDFSQKKDEVDFDWGIKIHNFILEIFGKSFYWQPIFSHLGDVDLVIVEQASRLLVNYPLLLLSILKAQKMAFWGHGRNFQSTKKDHISEWIKKQTSNRADWYFAYTQKSADIVHRSGYPYDRITVVQNAIDTEKLRQLYDCISTEEINNFKNGLNLNSKYIGLYVGGMYPNKELAFLLKACELLRSRIPDFQMLFVGSGVDSYLVEESAKKNDWIRYIGPKFDKDKVLCFKAANVFLMPGVVGLAILDCFAMELPLITTERFDHGPEIDYLTDRFNGLMVPASHDPQAFADAVCNIFFDNNLMEKLKEGCKRSTDMYTVEKMVNNFADGIVNAVNYEKIN
jgi:L-malate glycosyltransferase